MTRILKSSAGFTLIELLVVVCIVATTVALAAPAVSSALAEGRTSQAAMELISMSRRMRMEAIGTNRTRILGFTNANNGTFTLSQGSTNLCNAGIVNAPFETLTMNASRYSAGDSVVSINLEGNAVLRLCYQPNGVVQIDITGANIYGPFPAGREAYSFSFARTSGQGVTRTVLFPMNGIARTP